MPKSALKPRIISPAKKAEFQQTRERIWRGTIIAEGPKMGAAEISRINVSFLPSGEIMVPRYERKEGAIQLKHVKIGGSVEAIRQGWHQIRGTEKEEKRLDSAHAMLQGAHEVLLTQWNEFNKLQRQSAINYISEIRRSIAGNPRRLRDEIKLKAIQRLEKTEFLLKESMESSSSSKQAIKLNAACASLIGAANDLIERKNLLLVQRPYLKRRKASISEEKKAQDKLFFELIERAFEADSILSRASLGKESIARLRANLDEMARKNSVKKDRRLRQAGALARQALNALTEEPKKNGKAISRLRAARKLMVEAASETSSLKAGILQWVERHKDKAFKKKIAKNQLIYFMGNIEYGYSVATPRQKQNLHAYLLRISNALSGAGMNQIQTQIAESAKLLSNGKINECIEKLQKATAKLA